MKTFLTIIISFFLSNSIFSQSIEQTLAFAERKMELNEYDLALEAYNRVWFFNENDSLRSIIAFKLASCYFQKKEYENAKKYYDIAYQTEKEASSKNEIIFKKVFTQYLSGEYQYALMELFSLPDDLSFNHERSKNFYLGLIYFQQENYEDSEQSFNNCFNENGEMQNKIDSLFHKVEKLNKNWPRISQYMSVFVPGSGQLANGEIKSGLNSLALTSGVFILYTYTIRKYGFVNAIISVLPWFGRYHRGGYENATRIAIEKQKEKRNNILFNLVELYEQNLNIEY